MVESKIAALRQKLEQRADSGTRDWWQRYVKGGAPFMGVKMADIRSVMHQWFNTLVANDLDANQQMALALALFFEEYTEEKLAGILFIQEILLPSRVLTCEDNFDQLARLFNPGGIYDWNVCDWFSVKVLGPLIVQGGEGCARRVSEWSHVENLWQARASLVAFVRVANDRALYPLIEKACQVLIQREERFAKTAVGWVLRDVSKYDQSLVGRIIAENIQNFSSESLRNATKYFTKEEQSAYLQRFRS